MELQSKEIISQKALLTQEYNIQSAKAEMTFYIHPTTSLLLEGRCNLLQLDLCITSNICASAANTTRADRAGGMIPVQTSKAKPHCATRDCFLLGFLCCFGLNFSHLFVFFFPFNKRFPFTEALFMRQHFLCLQ